MLRRNLPVAALLLVAAACGAKSLFVSSSLVSPSAPDKVMDCTKAQFDSMGYKVSRYDQYDRRIEAKKLRRDIHNSNPNFFKAYDAIWALMSPDSTGNTQLKLEGHSFYDTRTYAGPKDQEQSASDTVKTDMARLAQRCGTTQLY